MKRRNLPEEVTILFGPLWSSFGRVFANFSGILVATGVGIAFAMVLYGKDPQQTIQTFLEQKIALASTIPDSTAHIFAEKIAKILPALMLLLITLIMLLNLQLANALAQATKWTKRPSLGFFSMSLPLWYSYILITTAVLSLIGAGPSLFIAHNVAIFLTLGFFLIGLGRILQILKTHQPFYRLLLLFAFIFLTIPAWAALTLYGAYTQWGLYDTLRIHS